MCCESWSLKANWVLACYLLVLCWPISSLAAGSTLGKIAVVALQHRDFDAPNLALEERLVLAVRRSHARKARLEGTLNKARGEEGGVSFSGGAKVGDGTAKLVGLKAETGECRAHNETGAKSRAGEAYAAEVEAVDGAFLASVLIGTPPVRMRAILDTGSDLVWQQCMPCRSCYLQPDLPIFDPSLSSSFKKATCSHTLCQQLLRSSSPSSPCSPSSPNVSCSFTYTYGDNSFTSGELAFDTLTLLHPRGQECVQVKEFAFGCGYANHGASFTGADGILGMGQGPLSLASQLPSHSFSYCLTSLTTSRPSYLLLGDHATDFLQTEKGSQVQVTSILTNKFMPTFYYLNLTGMSMDGVHLDISAKTFSLKSNGSGGMIVDSGTTITYLQEHGYQVVLRAIQSKLSGQSQKVQSMFGLDLCFRSLNESMLPNLTFHFDGATMEVPSTSLFIQATSIYCLALGGSHDFSILE
ncbi:hypothetical protein GOP47_0020662 [Adiantum capillus-veneris]|uniref:Peptidase A1 domain-containing protein n=1 Tax=Adiantum capillus-veneris TaxID=13818 RepID=A0A9D4U9Y4_ADICA|nr:hypothetical protein GOP47_0020662 [Adiantum capillus-veneris]